jgi:hypothetical protein
MGRLLLIIVCCAVVAFGQQGAGSLKGQVSDEFGGVIVGASVVAVNANGVEKTAATNGEGTFVLNGLAPGKYTVRITAPGFATYENAEVELAAGKTQPLNVTLKVTIDQQKVTVPADTVGVNTEPENNIGAIVLKGADLESLPDDPDDLAAALQALAGPSAGPNGGQIYVDGFTGGRLPPLSTIREIRINSNPYSAEYDRPGFGRTEIFTKPGTDSFRGAAFFSFNNQNLNSRNPFASSRPPYSSRRYGGELSGPIIKKKASFFADFEKRDINDQAIIVATVLDSNLNIVGLSQTVAVPNRRPEFSVRFDYALSPKHTLVARYENEHSNSLTGVGGFSLASRIYKTANTQQTVRLTETSILNRRTVNETRAQFSHNVSSDDANNTIPTIQVQEAFTGGGSQAGKSSNTQNRWELSNTTSLALGNQTVRFGARMRHVSITNISPQNFGGTWTFAGSRTPGNPGLTSIQAYQITLQGLQAGLTPAAIRAAGGGATQFTIAAGNPQTSVSQWDFGGFGQDDWKLRPNFMLSLGLRYENQDNINSNFNFAPRLGFAWAPGPVSRQHPAKTTIRGGFGLFYDRISENLTMTAIRLNGFNQQQFIVTDPAVLNSFPNIPSVANINASPNTIYRLAPDIQAPYTMQSALSIERALPHNFTMSATYSHSRTLHLLRARAINAPLPGTFIAGVPGSGTRPLGVTNNIFEYESSGRFDQNQFIVTVGSRFSKNISLNANYTFSKINSDSDGAGTFPANSYNLNGEYGRASNDIRHRFSLFGNVRAPWGLSLNPFLIVSSGAPFNITIGRDLNGDALFTDRPAFATDPTRPGVVVTRFGTFDPNPVAGAQIIPRNFGQGPGAVTANLRVSKTWSFGGEKRTTATQTQPDRGAGEGGGTRGGAGGGLAGIGGGGPRGGGGGPGRGGAGGGGRGGAGGGGASRAGGGRTESRYSLTFSMNFQNILNHANLGRPVGNLSSSFFGLSTSSAGGFGGGGGRGGGTPPYNRLIDAQVRFSF